MKAPGFVGLGVALMWGGAAVLASRQPSLDPPEAADSGEAATAVSRLFGSGREVISRQLYLEADRYFHRGASHVHERAFADHPYLRWAEAITPTDHVEVSADGIDEIMPWLRLATQTDPRNVQAYTTAAYWLNLQGKTDAARQVLDEASSRNPGDYRVPLARGQLLYHCGIFAEALTVLDQARAEWPSGQDPEDRQTRLDLAATLSLGAGIHELQGRRDEAIARFRELLAMFPARDGVREHLRRLELGKGAGDAAEFLDAQLEEISSARGGHHIAGGGHDHDEHGDEDHDHEDLGREF